MSGLSVEVSENGHISLPDASYAYYETEDFAKLDDRPRLLTLENRQRSLDGRSLSEFSHAISPNLTSRNENISRLADHLENMFSTSRRSGFNTPRSGLSTPRSYATGFEPHPIVGEAWEALRRSLVYFRGQPVGTIAALDNSEEKLNYDQANTHFAIIFFLFLLLFILLKRLVSSDPYSGSWHSKNILLNNEQ